MAEVEHEAVWARVSERVLAEELRGANVFREAAHKLHRSSP